MDEARRRQCEAAAYLERPLVIERQIREVIERRQEVEQAGLHGIDYSRSGGSRSADQTSRTERLAVKAAELEEEKEQLLSQWFDADDANMNVISKVYQLDARSALYLSYLYLSGRSMSEIERLTGYSREYIRQLKNHALLIAYKVISEEEPDAQAKSGPTSKEALP